MNPPRDPNVITVDVEVVNILCTVRDRKGAFVNDLSRDDFHIREDGRPQEIRYFTREVDTPIVVALLLDVSGSVRRILDIEKNAASRFLAEVLRPADRALFVTFAQTVAVWQDLTSNLDRLNTALQAAHPFDPTRMPEFRPHGGTLLYEAVNLVADKKLARVPGRKAMVIITDGVDSGSIFAAGAAVKAAQNADSIIYGIHYADDGSTARNFSTQGAEALRKLAEPTGGRMFHVSGGLPLETVFKTIREEMRNQYAIGYTSTNRARDGAYRRIEIKTARPGVRVQARQGYYR
ncbi:MAG: VWA domain-containing protein [Candidatus Sulfopaludibacter sp.]|nr:VWA domain-containing protein [Candidatus Sulfopaludibacter sp.]